MVKGESERNKKHPMEKMGEDRLAKSQKADERSRHSMAKLSDERYRVFIESINEGVYEVDIHGNFIYFNDSLSQIFGYPREEIQWQNISQFMDKKNRRMAYQAFSRVFITHKGFSDILLEIIDKKGDTRAVELSANLITNKEGKKIGFRGIARDVTERIKAQEALRKSEVRYQRQYEASRKAERRLGKLLDFVPYPMVVFKLDGTVTYLNPAFTEVFGWTFEDLRGKQIPYVPPELQEETKKTIEKLMREKTLRRYRTRRLTKDGRIRDVIMKGAVISDQEGEPGVELIILRDITEERRLARINESLLRISRALPEYPDLGGLLDYISSEIKRVLNVEGALVVLLDQERNELFFQGVAHDDRGIQRRAKRFRYPDNVTVGSKVIKSGEPVIVPDTAKDPNFYTGLDDQLGFHTRSMLDVPLKSSDRVIGVLSAINKKQGEFDQTDVELLGMIAGTVALSIENARFAEEVKEAYREVTSLNRAKDRVINRLSHELKTPVSILSASLNILEKKLGELPDRSWSPTLDRARRNVQRILEVQYQVEDIMENRQYGTRDFLSLLLDQCADELESLVAAEVGEGRVVERLRGRIEEIYGPRQSAVAEVPFDDYVRERLQTLQPQFTHRQIEVITRMEQVPQISIAEDVLGKVVDGLIRNAIENTPDGGRLEIAVHRKGLGAELVVQDYGVGITAENRKRIFEGFFSTQETIAYSSKRPFDFNAGGKGADLLRIKIFAERYHFKIHMDTIRCRFIPRDEDICPGKISECRFCHGRRDCLASGGTEFRVFFPKTPVEDRLAPNEVS